MRLHIYAASLHDEFQPDHEILVAVANQGCLQVYLDSYQSTLESLFGNPVRLKDGRVLAPWSDEQLRYIATSALLPLGLAAEAQ